MKILKSFPLSVAFEVQAITMPRRARIVHVERRSPRTVWLYAEVESDETTAALDTNKHQRSFALRSQNDPIPENGGFVGADGSVLIYEVRTP